MIEFHLTFLDNHIILVHILSVYCKIFICLDGFHSIVHNITKDSTDLEAWLTFLSATDVETITSLINAFPFFAAVYQEIADFVKKPEELMNMLSEALYIMDKNMERMMVTELQEKISTLKVEQDIVKAECDAVKSERDAAKSERDAAKSERDAARAKLQQVLDYAKAHGYQDESV